MDRKLLILLIIFYLIQIPLLFSTLTGDESVYFMMGKVVSEGKVPYQDFFYGHPPLQVYLYAGLIKLFGMHIWILKSFTLLFIIGSTILLYLIAKERYDEKIALVAAFLFLTSYDILIFGSFAFGLEIAIFFFMLSWYYLNKKPCLSGVFMGLAIATRLHVLTLGIILWLHSKDKLNFTVGCSVCLPYYCGLLNIPNFFSNVFGYHAGKLAHTDGWFSFFRTNLPLFILLSYSFKKIKDSLTFEFTLAYCAFLLIVGSVFEYFFLPITIILSIEGAYALTYSRFKKYLWVVILIWTIMMGVKVGIFVYNTSIEYNDYINYIKTIDGDIMGESSLASLIALKTGKEIHNLEIDTNFQRRQSYNFSNSLVVYNERVFNGLEFNCTLLNVTTINDNVFKLWKC